MVAEEVLALPRKQRRLAYLKARRKDKSVDWHDYRRWDGGNPNILKSVDLLKVREARKKAERESGAAGRMPVFMLGVSLKGLARHRMFRRKA
jgi:hypothetical protein